MAKNGTTPEQHTCFVRSDAVVFCLVVFWKYCFCACCSDACCFVLGCSVMVLVTRYTRMTHDFTLRVIHITGIIWNYEHFYGQKNVGARYFFPCNFSGLRIFTSFRLYFVRLGFSPTFFSFHYAACAPFSLFPFFAAICYQENMLTCWYDSPTQPELIAQDKSNDIRNLTGTLREFAFCSYDLKKRRDCDITSRRVELL